MIETGKISFNKHYLKTSVEVNLNIEKTFNFFSKPSNLNLITPNWLNFNILNTSDVNSFEGAKFYYNIKLHGITIKWNSIISEWNPYKSFRDIQIKGPYSLWHHTHTFIENDGITTIHDKIRYIVPLGILGRLLNRLWIANDLKYIFEYRKNIINEYFDNRSNK